MTALKNVLATPVGQVSADVIVQVAAGGSAGQVVEHALLGTQDLELLGAAAGAGVRPLDLARHLATLWPGASRADQRLIIGAGDRLLGHVASTLHQDSYHRWWATFDPSLVLAWAAGPDRNLAVMRLRSHAAYLVLPMWLAGDLPGAPALHRVRRLVEHTVRYWDEEFLTGLNDALSTMDTGGALRERIVKLVDREVASRQRARQRPDRQAEVNKPLRKMALDSATLGAWLMDSVPDDRHAWALLLEMTTVDVDDYSNQRTLRQVVDAVNGVVTT